ncbi:uncharacterized protein LOC116096971 isoform X2 [Mastomys coucha]|uniref:uncharacterized protein LOC116096971 isoform X2 n=1 Tax=Mastomys coucha TaxID=35658 RepID=UPI0012614736|nr:uncharacterized protein LOC116096971 isoform X2 [Mastomys coucha]
MTSNWPSCLHLLSAGISGSSRAKHASCGDWSSRDGAEDVQSLEAVKSLSAAQGCQMLPKVKGKDAPNSRKLRPQGTALAVSHSRAVRNDSWGHSTRHGRRVCPPALWSLRRASRRRSIWDRWETLASDRPPWQEVGGGTSGRHNGFWERVRHRKIHPGRCEEMEPWYTAETSILWGPAGSNGHSMEF